MYSSHVCKSCHARLWRRQRLLRLAPVARSLHDAPRTCASLSLTDEASELADNLTESRGYAKDIFESYMREKRGTGRYSRFLDPALGLEEEANESASQGFKKKESSIEGPLSHHESHDGLSQRHISPGIDLSHEASRPSSIGEIQAQIAAARAHLLNLQKEYAKASNGSTVYKPQRSGLIRRIELRPAEATEQRSREQDQERHDPDHNITKFPAQDQTQINPKARVQTPGPTTSTSFGSLNRTSQQSDQVTASPSSQEPPSEDDRSTPKDALSSLIPSLPTDSAVFTRQTTHRNRRLWGEGGTRSQQESARQSCSFDEGNRNNTAAMKPNVFSPGPATTLANAPLLRVERRWKGFEKRYPSRDSPAFQSPVSSDIKPLAEKIKSAALLHDIVKAWCSGPQDALPKPLVAIERMMSLGIIEPNAWSSLLCTGAITVARLSTVNASSPKNPTGVLLLMEMWRAFCYQHMSHTSSGLEVPQDWSFLPSGQIYMAKTYFIDALAGHFPIAAAWGATTRLNLAGAALITTCVLIHERSEFHMTETQVEESWPFVKFISSTLCGTLFPKCQMFPFSRLLRSLDRGTGAFEKWTHIINNMDKDIRDAKTVSHVPGGGGTHRQSVPDEDSDPQIRVERAITRLGSKIGRATEAQDLLAIRRLWTMAPAECKSATGKPLEVIPDGLIIKFLHAFMKTNDMEYTIKVWNTMQHQGTEPTEWVWITVLSGCNDLRDPEALDGFWKKMLESGFQPTVRTWTARIHGVMMMRSPYEGLRLLEEVGNSWEASFQRMTAYHKQKKGNPTKDLGPPPVVTAKPNIELVNAAVNAISEKNQSWDMIERLLEWTKAFDLKFTSYTYNPIIRLAFRQGNVQKAYELIEEMRSKDIEPDKATYALIVSNLFRGQSFSSPDWEETVEKRVEAILADLKQRNALTKYTFTALVDGLVRQNQIKVVDTVLQVLVKLEQSIPATIFTILARHNFEQPQPNLARLDALWSRAIGQNAYTDNVFLDRMIEGWAKLGEIGRMREVLTWMVKKGKQPSWTALRAMIQALAQNDDFPGVAQVVLDVKNELTPSTAHKQNYRSRAFFWQFVRGLRDEGLLDDPRVNAQLQRYDEEHPLDAFK